MKEGALETRLSLLKFEMSKFSFTTLQNFLAFRKGEEGVERHKISELMVCYHCHAIKNKNQNRLIDIRGTQREYSSKPLKHSIV